MSEMHAETVPFVRDSMLPPAAPPTRQGGAVLWLRENLFAGWLNTVLSILGFLAIWWLVDHLWDWFAHSVWNAASLAECRQIIAATWGEGARGACWGVIRERWNQFLFGFYPADLYWRPVLALGLLMVALAPVLFSPAPRLRRIIVWSAAVLTVLAALGLGAPAGWVVAMALAFAALTWLNETAPARVLGFTALYPLIGVWLLWGGSVWPLVMLLVAVAVAGAAWRALAGWGGTLALAGGVLAGLAFWAVAAGPLASGLEGALPLRIPAVASSEFGGFLLAFVIGVSGIAMSLPLGIVLALARQSNMPIVKMFAVMFIEFIRGVPLITLLFVASILLNYFLPPGTNFDIILRVIIMVTLFASAYMAEVIRGGLAALPRGQYEAADALGLDYWKAQRLIVLPQALKISIPGIVSTFIGMFKDTTLVGLIGLFDPLKGVPDFIRANFAWKGVYWEPFIFTGTIFFVICFAMSRYSMWLERRLHRDHR